jgi:hypothetical protein
MSKLFAECSKVVEAPLAERSHWVLPNIEPVRLLNIESMSEIMDEHDQQQEQRHREQLAVVERLAVASEISARSAKESESAAQESLELTRKSLRNSRIANWFAFAALILTAWAAYVAVSSA